MEIKKVVWVELGDPVDGESEGEGESDTLFFGDTAGLDAGGTKEPALSVDDPSDSDTSPVSSKRLRDRSRSFI